MKRILFFAIIMAACTRSAQAQLEVDSLGRVRIGYSGYVGTNKIQIGSPLDNTAGVTISNVGHTTAMKLYKLAGDTVTTTGFHLTHESPTSYNVGIYSNVNSYGNPNKGTPNIAIKGVALKAKYTVGVYGETSLTPEDSANHLSGAGIYGTSSYLYRPNFKYEGRYAGYFNGVVRVSGAPLYAALITPSMYYSTGGTTQNNSATLISEERGESVAEKLSQVGAIQFMRDEREMVGITEEIPAEERERLQAEGYNVDEIQEAARNAKPTLSSIQYGLAADQLKKVYPELVYEDSEGNVSINYIEMIPLLVESINELSRKVATLEGGNAVKAKAQTTAIEETTEDIDQVRMDQNKPNPFSGSTVISLNVPESTKQAAIYIYDLSGKQVQSLPVTERGETDITVYASGLSAGMYIYTLVVDGQVKVTRKMMVTE